jgi:hypothetical protein
MGEFALKYGKKYMDNTFKDQLNEMNNVKALNGANDDDKFHKLDSNADEKKNNIIESLKNIHLYSSELIEKSTI